MQSYYSILKLQEKNRQVPKRLVQFLGNHISSFAVLSQIRDDEDGRHVGSVNRSGDKARNISGRDHSSIPRHQASLRPTLPNWLSLQTSSD